MSNEKAMKILNSIPYKYDDKVLIGVSQDKMKKTVHTIKKAMGYLSHMTHDEKYKKK